MVDKTRELRLSDQTRNQWLIVRIRTIVQLKQLRIMQVALLTDVKGNSTRSDANISGSYYYENVYWVQRRPSQRHASRRVIWPLI